MSTSDPADASGPAGPAPALRRGLAVLSLLAARPSPLSAAAIARELGLPRSTTYELLHELAAAGFAAHLGPQRRWGLGVAAFEIGSAYQRADPLTRVGTPVLVRLARTTGGTAQLGVLHGAETLYLAKEQPDRAGRTASPPTLVTDVGVRLPGQLTATGLSILAGLPAEQVRALFPSADRFVMRTARGPADPAALRARLAAVRRRGWADEDCQVSPGTASVAAAVHDHSGRPLAAVGVTVRHRCPAPDDPVGCGTDLAGPAGLAAAVQEAARSVTAAIGGRWPGTHAG
ncbi:helix-turn-helix domain-containing protein [Nakamurella sp. YIM 132087]|uniref:Helix-turn-helix domain-containing protein n=1 Tax=Nakamurella alba TaxID=2665158 RepID=A0A7K1FFW1_9ACTN|nr:IclR family transcriptional regulator [Nakamurella alba]MTD13001.1 helix-turn-helix domain-containing protein [Nakamurella alba]